MLRNLTPALCLVGLAFAAGAHLHGREKGAGHSAPLHQDAAAGQKPPAAPDEAALDRGRLLYGFYCMSCHGGDGRGGVDGGSDLRESAMLAADDGGKQFAAFLPEGRPEQRMPPTPLADHEIAALWAFLQVLVPAPVPAGAEAAGDPVMGDATLGQRHFKTAGCGGCHSITGDLAKIGTRLEASAIHTRLLLPPAGGRKGGAASTPGAANALRRHTESVKGLSEQALRDLAAYLATLR